MVCEERRNRIGIMAKSKRRRSSKTLRHFYLNDELHKTLKVNRSEDLIFAWNYPQGKRVAYVLSDTRVHMQRAYSVKQVSEIFDRDHLSIRRYITRRNINPPQHTYKIDDPSVVGKYMFSKKDIYALHDFLLTVNRGRPRNDGILNRTNAPSRRELEAILNNDTVLYVKGADGEFTPVWKQPEW